MWRIMHMDDPGEAVLPPLNRQDNRGGADADTSPFLGPADVGSGVLPRDRFRRPSNAVAGAPQRPLVTPQHYAMAGALPPEPPAKAFPALSEGAARALAARVVELEERLRMVEASATRTQAMESRLMALERRAQGAEQGSRAAATAVDDEARRMDTRVAEIAAELARSRRESSEARMKQEALARELHESRAAVRDLQAELARLAQVSSETVRGSQEYARQRFLTMEQQHRDAVTQMERLRAAVEAVRAECADTVLQVRSRVETGEGRMERMREVEVEVVQATAEQLSKMRGEVSRAESAAEGARKAAAMAAEATRAEVEKLAARIAQAEAQAEASCKAALVQANTSADTKVARVERTIADLIDAVKANQRAIMQEVTKKSEALARAMASDRKDMQDKVHAVDKRATEVLAMAHRAEDDVVKRIDRATRDNLRVMAELRTLIEATDHKIGRQMEQVAQASRGMLTDAEESQERRRRQLEEVVRMEIQARIRSDEEVKLAAAKGFREIRGAMQHLGEALKREVAEAAEGLRQQVDGVTTDHMLEESLVRVEAAEQVQAAEGRLRAALAESVSAAEERLLAQMATRVAEGSMGGDRVAAEVDAVRGAVEQVRAVADVRMGALEARLDRAMDDLQKALERAGTEARAALEQERRLREQGDHELRMELVRGDADVLAKLEIQRAEHRAAAERHVRSTAEHFKKTAREQSDTIARLAGALEAGHRTLEGTVQVLELDVSRLRGQLDAVSVDVTWTRGALFEAVEEAMGRHAQSVGGRDTVGDVVRLAAEVRGVCETLEQHMAHRIAAVESRMADVDRRAREAALARSTDTAAAAMGFGVATPASLGATMAETTPIRAGHPGWDVQDSGVKAGDALSEAIREIRAGAGLQGAAGASVTASVPATAPSPFGRRLTFEEERALEMLRGGAALAADAGSGEEGDALPQVGRDGAGVAGMGAETSADGDEDDLLPALGDAALPVSLRRAGAPTDSVGRSALSREPSLVGPGSQGVQRASVGERGEEVPLLRGSMAFEGGDGYGDEHGVVDACYPGSDDSGVGARSPGSGAVGAALEGEGQIDESESDGAVLGQSGGTGEADAVGAPVPSVAPRDDEGSGDRVPPTAEEQQAAMTIQALARGHLERKKRPRRVGAAAAVDAGVPEAVLEGGDGGEGARKGGEGARKGGDGDERAVEGGKGAKEGGEGAREGGKGGEGAREGGEGAVEGDEGGEGGDEGCEGGGGGEGAVEGGEGAREGDEGGRGGEGGEGAVEGSEGVMEGDEGGEGGGGGEGAVEGSEGVMEGDEGGEGGGGGEGAVEGSEGVMEGDEGGEGGGGGEGAPEGGEGGRVGEETPHEAGVELATSTFQSKAYSEDFEEGFEEEGGVDAGDAGEALGGEVGEEAGVGVHDEGAGREGDLVAEAAAEAGALQSGDGIAVGNMEGGEGGVGAGNGEGETGEGEGGHAETGMEMETPFENDGEVGEGLVGRDRGGRDEEEVAELGAGEVGEVQAGSGGEGEGGEGAEGRGDWAREGGGDSAAVAGEGHGEVGPGEEGQEGGEEWDGDREAGEGEMAEGRAADPQGVTGDHRGEGGGGEGSDGEGSDGEGDAESGLGDYEEDFAASHDRIEELPDV